MLFCPGLGSSLFKVHPESLLIIVLGEGLYINHLYIKWNQCIGDVLFPVTHVKPKSNKMTIISVCATHVFMNNMFLDDIIPGYYMNSPVFCLLWSTPPPCFTVGTLSRQVTTENTHVARGVGVPAADLELYYCSWNKEGHHWRTSSGGTCVSWSWSRSDIYIYIEHRRYHP